MNPCDDYIVQTLRYLANDLKGAELEQFRSHLTGCADCRAHLAAEEALSKTLVRSRPLYSAPAALRNRVSAAATQQHSPRNTVTAGAFERVSIWRVLVPAALAIGICLALVPSIERNVQAARYVETAVEVHRRFLHGDLSPDVRSTSPRTVTAWFAGKVPFDFRLPDAESIAGDKPAYQLTGAALVSYKSSPAALVTYDAPQGKISLLVASGDSAVVGGGDQVSFGKLTFHTRTDAGFRVITWSNHNLAYALVSSISVPPRASCLVCHQNMADHNDFSAERWPLIRSVPHSTHSQSNSNPL